MDVCKDINSNLETTADISQGNNPAAISTFQVAAYSGPAMVTGFLSIPLVMVLPSLYVKNFGLSLTSIAAILFFARMFDAITDPIIGYLSDYTRARTGTRKPWVLVGALLFIASSYYLYTPPESADTLYLLCWVFLFYLSWTLFEIPHITWGGELAKDSVEKTKIYSIRYFFLKCGITLFYVIPLFPVFQSSGFTLETMRWSAICAVVLMVPLIYLNMRYVPSGHQYENASNNGQSLRKTLSSVIQNKPLLVFIGGYCFSGAAIGMWGGISYIFFDSYLSLGEKLPIIYTFGYVIGLLSIKVSFSLSVAYERRWVLVGGMVMVLLNAFFLGSIEPGPNAFILTTVGMCIAIVGSTSFLVLAPSLLSDIVDYGAWKFGENRGAMYFSVYTFLNKASLGLGTALSLGIIGWYEFDPALSIHTSESLFGLRLALIYLPVTFTFIAIVFFSITSINERRHKIILKRLESRGHNRF